MSNLSDKLRFITVELPPIVRPSVGRSVAGELVTMDLTVCGPAEVMTRFLYPTVVGGFDVTGGTAGNNRRRGGGGNGGVGVVGEPTNGRGIGRELVGDGCTDHGTSDVASHVVLIFWVWTEYISIFVV